jgi:hypothetical protein
VSKPSIVHMATLPLILAIPTVLAVGAVPQIHVMLNTAALPPMPVAVPAVMPKMTPLPMPIVVSKVGALPPVPDVVPKVGDLPPMTSSGSCLTVDALHPGSVGLH